VVSETHGPADMEHGLTHVGEEHGHHDGLVQHQFNNLEQQRESTTMAMWLFLATEVMMFGGLFFAYTLYRSKFDAAFHEGAAHMNLWLGTANTGILLVSSLTMAMAVYSAAVRERKKLVLFLSLTWILGAAFLVVKAFEWGHDLHIGLIPGVNWTYYDDPAHLAPLRELNILPQQVQMFFVIYFCMTGLHAIHMIVGLALVGVFIYLSWRGQFTNGNDQPVEIMGLYWHLVDIIWVFLFPLLYLIAGFHPWQAGGH
jgi:cytochrome c oxidase subunit III